MTHLFHVHKIGKSYDGKVVLDELTLSITQGEVVCVLGAAKGGKSTFIRCLMLLERIDRGFIEYGGLPVIGVASANGNGGNGKAAKTPRRPALHVREHRFRRKFGVVFPSRNLFPNRTVLQNVVEGALHVNRIPRRTALETGRSLLATVEMAEKAGDYPETLTAGEQQRVALARAFAAEPEVVFLDEITSTLDPPETARLFRCLRTLRDEHSAAIVMATNHAKFAADFADLLCFLHEGRFLEKGSPRRLVTEPRSEPFQQFLKSVRASW
ncbi:MAG: amino acid ABC transporter ATP-binding protein [Phycisphaerales bacterium]|nr:ATP-binding cassette domain-containing protein [Phycisphaerae bacterium]NNF43158.1 amino acid ABC transporter ATP-binding protein [Phycisphaerales bacterium]NNM27272.1 amino acid ABC transporter ATP-binding protein [Phycisphaerales bacterium]